MKVLSALRSLLVLVACCGSHALAQGARNAATYSLSRQARRRRRRSADLTLLLIPEGLAQFALQYLAGS